MKKDINQLTYDYSITMREYTNNKITELNKQYDIIDKLYSDTIDAVKAIEKDNNITDLTEYNQKCDNTFVYSKLLDVIASQIDALTAVNNSIDIIADYVDTIDNYIDTMDSLKYKLGLL